MYIYIIIIYIYNIYSVYIQRFFGLNSRVPSSDALPGRSVFRRAVAQRSLSEVTWEELSDLAQGVMDPIPSGNLTFNIAIKNGHL
jgi:hypothetical protein